MFAIPETSALCPIGVLLGGSGRARPPCVRPQVVPALLKPLPAASGRTGSASECRAAGV
jgi:hypothetical protein